jgi:hypothetical protein
LIGRIDDDAIGRNKLECLGIVGEHPVIDLVRREIGDDLVVNAFEQEVASGRNGPF